jgi:mannosyl-oligosaccharide glucosidase
MRPLWLLLLPLAPSVYSQPKDDSQDLLWGTYRPNLYFGLRPKIPQSLMVGLMWFGTTDYNSVNSQSVLSFQIINDPIDVFVDVRHACDQGDELDGYTWTDFDARKGAVQVIKDGKNNVKITTEFLKFSGGDHGGSWAARIKGEPINTCMSESGWIPLASCVNVRTKRSPLEIRLSFMLD